MKLLTLNCHSWQEDDQLEKIKKLAMTIHEKSYDVIALQEVSQLITAKKVDHLVREDNFAHILLKELHALGSTAYRYVWDFAHIGYEKYEEGVALLTKHPIIKHDSFFVTNSQDTNFWKTRKIVQVTIDFYGKPLSFLTCHLGWWQDREEPFRNQIDTLLEHLDLREQHFLMGDFNNEASVRGEGYNYILENGFHDSYQLAKRKDKGVTVKGNIAGWDDDAKDKRNDFIFVPEDVEVLSSHVIFNGINKHVIYDHFGIEVVVEIYEGDRV